MASTIKVNTLDSQTGTEVEIATGKKISGDNTQYKITGGALNEVLQSNGAGGLTWGGMAGFTAMHFVEADGSTSWTVPTGAKKLLVYLTGGGGAGGGGGPAGEGSGGGAGGTTVSLITVSGGEVTTIEIGAYGTGGTSADGTAGGDSQFTYVSGGTSFSTVIAKGGTAGKYHGIQAVSPAGTVGATNTGIAFYGGMGTSCSHGGGMGGASMYGSGGSGGHPSAAGTGHLPFPALAAGAGGGGGISTAAFRMSAIGADGCIVIHVFK
tara:strand:+ start:292 stop:1089 length:798 start_codon:yes stop_codon:yes gene_type:complete